MMKFQTTKFHHTKVAYTQRNLLKFIIQFGFSQKIVDMLEHLHHTIFFLIKKATYLKKIEIKNLKKTIKKSSKEHVLFKRSKL